MKKEIEEFAGYLKENIYLIIVLIVLLTPTIWGIASIYYDGRIETYKSQNEVLKDKNKELEEENKELELKKDVFKEALTQESSTDWTAIKSK